MEDKSSQSQTVRMQAARKQRAREKAFTRGGRTWQAHQVGEGRI